MVVIDPAPAIRGNAIGKIAPLPCASWLKICMPRIISIAIRKIMNAPAIANDETSIPKTPSNGVPINRKARKMAREVIVTFADLILTPFDLRSTIIGIDPGMSMMAKRTIKAANISLRLRCIDKIFANIKKFPLFAYSKEGELIDGWRSLHYCHLIDKVFCSGIYIHCP